MTASLSPKSILRAAGDFRAHAEGMPGLTGAMPELAEDSERPEFRAV